jgi:tyrosine-specific transport protein
LEREENANEKSELKTIENGAVVTRLWSNVSEDAGGGGYAHESGSVLGNAALIAGTTVGAGVLALPEITGPTGFVASSEMLVAMWAYFVATGYCLAEVNLATLCALGGSGSKNGVSLFSVTRSTLGKGGAAIFSLAYVFMHECLTVACCLKGAEILSSGKYIADVGFNEAIVLFGGFIGLFVALSSEKVLDFTNRLLVLFIVSALIGLVSLCCGDVDVANLQRSDFSVVGNTIPGIAVAFVYQSVLPSVVSSLEGDVPKIKKATVLGTAVPLENVHRGWVTIGQREIRTDILRVDADSTANFCDNLSRRVHFRDRQRRDVRGYRHLWLIASYDGLQLPQIRQRGV